MHPIQNGEIDTSNFAAFITDERINSFMFTNPYISSRFVALYSQQMNNTKFIDIKGIAAGVSVDVYLLTIVFCCLLAILFATINYVKPLNTFNCWNIATTILPCFNCQAGTLRIEGCRIRF